MTCRCICLFLAWCMFAGSKSNFKTGESREGCMLFQACWKPTHSELSFTSQYSHVSLIQPLLTAFWLRDAWKRKRLVPVTLADSHMLFKMSISRNACIFGHYFLHFLGKGMRICICIFGTCHIYVVYLQLLWHAFAHKHTCLRTPTSLTHQASTFKYLRSGLVLRSVLPSGWCNCATLSASHICHDHSNMLFLELR